MNMEEPIGYAEIETLIPHRAPFLLIDQLKNVVLGESITGIKAVSGNEPFFPAISPQPCDARRADCRGDGAGCLLSGIVNPA